MLRLKLSSGPEWVHLFGAVEVFVQPLTSGVVRAARAELAKITPPDIPEGGLDPEEGGALFTRAVARVAIRDWRGVETEAGDPAPVTPEYIDALLDWWQVHEAFQVKIIAPRTLLVAEGNVSALSPNGSTARAPDIASDAPPAAPIASG